MIYKKSNQSGITIIGALIILVLAGFIGVFLIRVVPMYIDFYNIKSTLETLRHEPGILRMSSPAIYNLIKKRFDISYVSNLTPSQVKIANRGNVKVLSLSYEDYRPLFANLSVVGEFDYQIELRP